MTPQRARRTVPTTLAAIAALSLVLPLAAANPSIPKQPTAQPSTQQPTLPDQTHFFTQHVANAAGSAEYTSSAGLGDDSGKNQGRSLAPTSRKNRPEPMTGRHVVNGRTQNTYDYAKAIRESVEVDLTRTAPKNTTAKIRVDIIRPREMAEAGKRAPVIVLPSPYYHSDGRGPEDQRKTHGKNDVPKFFPLWYDNFFVQHGYAVALVDSLGTAQSTGCPDVGGPEEIRAITNVIHWLNGRLPGQYVAGGVGAADATTWSTGDVGVIGKSYDGSIANGVAATGIDGLRTIVPISAISSWYQYVKYDGRSHREKYLRKLAYRVFNGKNNKEARKKCANVFRNIDKGDIDESSSRIWDRRNYLKHASHVKASVLIAHGQADMNVKIVNAGRWFNELRKHDVEAQLWLHDAAHHDPFDMSRAEWVDYLHKWLDHYISGLDVADVIGRVATIRQADGEIIPESIWPSGSLRSLILRPGGDDATHVRLKSSAAREHHLVAKPFEKRTDRVVYLTEPVKERVRLSGQFTLTATVSTDGGSSLPLSVKLVTYQKRKRFGGNVVSGGEDCWVGGTPQDTGCFKKRKNKLTESDYGIIGRGWWSGEHRNGSGRKTPIASNEPMTATVPIMMTDMWIEEGDQFGVVITLNDESHTDHLHDVGKVTIDLEDNFMFLSGRFSDIDQLEPSKRLPNSE